MSTETKTELEAPRGFRRDTRTLARRFLARYGWSVLGLPLVIGIMVLLFSILRDPFLTVSNFENVGRNIGPIALLSLGQGFVILIGQIDISVGAIVALSTVNIAFAVGDLGVVGFLAAPLTGAVVGFFNGVIFAKFHVHSVIVTIGTSTAVYGIAYLATNGVPVTGDFPRAFEWVGVGKLWIFPAPLIIAVVALLLSIAVLRYTRYGPMLYATGGNEEAARLAGLNIDLIKITAFMLCGMLAGLAGLIYASRINSGQPNLGQSLPLDAIAAAVVGGMALVGGKGTMTGVAMGVIVITILKNGLDITLSSITSGDYWKQFVTGVVILIAVIVDQLRERTSGIGFAEEPAPRARAPAPP